MSILRIGTRGSALALRQAQIVCDLLARVERTIRFEVVTVATDGDLHPSRPMDTKLPAGSFVSAIERALLERQVDVAIHSYKDLPIEPTAGLMIAAAPQREAVHDVLITQNAVRLNSLPSGFRVGTSSVRRAAQIRQLGNVIAVPIRGNVPTRIEKIGHEGLDGVMLAAAGVRRLGLKPQHMIDLPLENFLPAPAQGALAVQVRQDDNAVLNLVQSINDKSVHRAVNAERALLSQLGGGCAIPLGALAQAEGSDIVLSAQLFSEDGLKMAKGEQRGRDSHQVAESLAQRLAATLKKAR